MIENALVADQAIISLIERALMATGILVGMLAILAGLIGISLIWIGVRCYLDKKAK